MAQQSSHSQQLKNPKYRNWVKAGLGLKYVKEGLEIFSEDVAKQQHMDIITAVKNKHNLQAVTCGHCNLYTLQPDHVRNRNRQCPLGQNNCNCLHPGGKKPCPNNVCGAIYDEIFKTHASNPPTPYWKNTDVKDWCTDPWAVAKCFINAPGYATSAKAEEIDCTGLLHLYINSKCLQRRIQCQISGQDVFTKTRSARNSIYHSKHMEMEDVEVNEHIDNMIAVLEDGKELINRQESQVAVLKLKELRMCSFVMSTQDEAIVIKDAFDEIDQKVSQLKETVAKGDESITKKENEMVQSLQMTRQQLELKAREILENIKKDGCDIKRDLEIDLKNALDQLKTEMNNKTTLAKKTILKHKDEACIEIEQKKTAVIETMEASSENMKQSTERAILKHKEEACSELERTKSTSIEMMQRSSEKQFLKHKDETCIEIEQKKTTAFQTIEQLSENMKQSAERAILKHKEDACSEIERTKSTAIEMVQTSSEGMRTSAEKTLLKRRDEACVAIEQRETAAVETMAASVEAFSSKVYSSESALSDRIDKMEERLNTNEGKNRMKDMDALEQGASAYTQRKQDLRGNLITFYTSEHGTLLLDPLFEEKDTPVVNFYTMPDMNVIKTKWSLADEEVKIPVRSLSDVFSSDGKFSQNIYLTADAGFGKTAFSKYLALTWCQAHKEDSEYTEYFDENDLNAMRQFELFFLVFLRHSSSDCSIDDMILNQIIKNTGYSCTKMQSLQHILARKRHLVILDGLDEWTHPDRECTRGLKTIPHRNARENCVILSTTRPWKLGVINLKTSQISKKIELAKLSSESAELLKERAISKIKCPDIRQARILVKEFNAEVEKCSLGDLESVPLLLIYLIYLWWHKMPLGQSRSGLYTSITELLLSRTVKKYPDLEPMCEHSLTYFPQWLSSDHEHCKKYFPLLTALGGLAFHTLFSKTRENTLVFDSSVAEKILNKSELKFSLQSGIITQSKVQVSALKQSSKISFANKSVQEYFSALYMSGQSESHVQKIVQENCKSLQDILDMSAVFVFISGMNGEMMSTISRELISIISENGKTIAYRSTTDDDYSDPLRDIQNMYISCIKENPDNNDLKLCLQDFFIDQKCEQENYKTTLQRLAKQNKNNIQSVSVWNSGFSSLQEIIDSFELTDLNHLQKLYCVSNCKEADIVRLLSVTVKYAVIVNNSCPMTSALCRRFQALHQLEGIYIAGFNMSHTVLEEFRNYLTNRKSMKQIKLSQLSCTDHYSWVDVDSCTHEYDVLDDNDSSTDHDDCLDDNDSCTDHYDSLDDDDSCTDHYDSLNDNDSSTDHDDCLDANDSCTDRYYFFDFDDFCTNYYDFWDNDDSCTDYYDSCYEFKLDLSEHKELRTLKLEMIPLSQLNINVASLEECVVAEISKPGLASSWLSQLQASKLNLLKCGNLKSRDDIATLVQTLPLLVYVKKVELSRISLGGSSLRLSPHMVNLAHVKLWHMRMPSSSFRDLVKHAEQLPHTVTVEISFCTITPETECRAVKKYVRKSENFVVTRDARVLFHFVKSAVTTTTSD